MTTAAPRRPQRRTGRGVAVVVALLALAACRRDEVSHFVVPKEPGSGGALARPTSLGGAPGMPGMPAASGQVPAPPPPSGANALHWTLPAGWTESLSGGGMRYATIKPSTPGKLDVSVVVLPGPAGGELANVNRWRGQIGLAPVDDATLASSRKVVRTRAGPVDVYDFVSEGRQRTRMVAGLAVVGGSTWFLKMVGDAEPVGAARPEFLHLLESLHLADAN